MWGEELKDGKKSLSETDELQFLYKLNLIKENLDEIAETKSHLSRWKIISHNKNLEIIITKPWKMGKHRFGFQTEKNRNGFGYVPTFKQVGKRKI